MIGCIADRGVGHVARWRIYPVGRNVSHSAVAQTNCVFINIERWTCEVTSAADDFTAV